MSPPVHVSTWPYSTPLLSPVPPYATPSPPPTTPPYSPCPSIVSLSPPIDPLSPVPTDSPSLNTSRIVHSAGHSSTRLSIPVILHNCLCPSLSIYLRYYLCLC